MQLTRTNAVFSRIALVSSFVQKNQLSGKTPIFIAIIIIHRKTHGARRGDEVAARGHHAIVGRGQGWARALVWRGRLGRPPDAPLWTT